MGLKSKRKGQRGELEVVHLLKSLGFSDARRTAQVRGKNGGCADVECPVTLPDIHIEVKNDADVFPGNVAFDRAWEQATADSADSGQWVALFWKSRGRWFATSLIGSMKLSATGDEIKWLLENHKETEASGG